MIKTFQSNEKYIHTHGSVQHTFEIVNCNGFCVWSRVSSRERHSFMNSQSGKRRSHLSTGHQWQKKKVHWFSEITWKKPNFYWLMWRALRELTKGKLINRNIQYPEKKRLETNNKINRSTHIQHLTIRFGIFFAEIFEYALIQYSPASWTFIILILSLCGYSKIIVWFLYYDSFIHIFFFFLRKWWLNSPVNSVSHKRKCSTYTSVPFITKQYWNRMFNRMLQVL